MWCFPFSPSLFLSPSEAFLLKINGRTDQLFYELFKSVSFNFQQNWSANFLLLMLLAVAGCLLLLQQPKLNPLNVQRRRLFYFQLNYQINFDDIPFLSKLVQRLSATVSAQVYLKMGQTRPLLFIFRSFQINIFQKKKLLVYSGIRTRIVGVECKHADHLTTTTAHTQVVSCCVYGITKFGPIWLFISFYKRAHSSTS